ncbi:sulfotransferase family protein [Mycobacterium sp. CBMA 234]|nr:sulfotransferase family protein [Mycolicibacterium sp. CBMA 234]MUL63417.1 sulfotransferase family protein [Mycolicibacterium sp. CBMA 234]
MFVVGFGRSGTSALTRVLSLCGAKLPPGLLGATGANPRGYWEPRQAIYLNEEILRGRGSSGYDMSLRTNDEGLFDAERNADYVAKLRAHLAALPAARLTVIKEPKLTAVSRLWFEAARQAGYDVATVIAVRHPQEVVESVANRASSQYYVRDSPELTLAWWLKFTLLAERSTRGLPRVFVEYANLLEDWRSEVKRISVALSVDLNASDDDAIENFLTADLRHYEYLGPVPEPFGTDWVSSVYLALSAAARDEPWDQSDLDRVYQAYRVGERGFSRAFEDHHRYRTLNRLMPLVFVKAGLAVLALAHRRRGTWA